MKYLAIYLALLAYSGAAQLSAQPVDEIVNKYIEALGGKEKLLSIKTIKMEGSLGVQGLEVGVTVTAVHMVGTRTDIAVPGMGEGFQIVNTTTGWNFMPFQGQASPQEITDAQHKASVNQLDVHGVLVNYSEKGHQVELLGKEMIEGAECYKLKVVNKEGKIYTLYIDTKTYYRVKSITNSPGAGGETETATTYSDFKKTPDGYVFPFTQSNARGTILFTSIEVNKPVNESIFKVE